MYVDSTLVKANVSGYGLANSGMTVEEFKEQAIEENGLFKIMETTVDGDGARHETARYFQSPKGRLPLNPVDTDSRWRTSRPGKLSGLHYQENVIVDLGGFIVATGVTHASQGEWKAVPDLLEQLPWSRSRWPEILARGRWDVDGAIPRTFQVQETTHRVFQHIMISRIVILLTCLLTIGILACGESEEERKTKALNAAQTWAEGNTDTIVSEIVELVTSDVPGASLFSDVIADQIVDALSWDFPEPTVMTEDIYRVPAVVSTQISFVLPSLGRKTYQASLPFDLKIDVNASSVTEWSVDLRNADISEL